MRIVLLALACAFQPLWGGGGLTVERIFHPTEAETFVETRTSTPLWRPDGTLLLERRDKGGFKVLDRREGAGTAPVLTRSRLQEQLAAAGIAPADIQAGLSAPFTWNGARTAFLVQAGAALVLADAGGAPARRLAEGDSPAFSPDGAWVAYLEGNDVRALELATGRVVKVTTGGGPTRLNGRLDWVYQEEVFNERGVWRGFWWSPDSRRIAFLSLDESPVPVFTLADDRTQPQKLTRLAYPKAGDPVPLPRLGVADLEGRVDWVEDPYPGQEVFVPRVGWDPKGRLLAHWTDRTQTWLECRVHEGAGPGRVLVREAQPRGWVEHLPLPRFLKDGRFLWLSSRTGNSHLYLCDGRTQVPVTSGPWDVKRLLGVDEKGGLAWFEGTRRSPVGVDAYRVPLAGGAPELLTP
ncbi:MAG TPA: DPP IV N-terminal domain-containing protein, partial [Holophaga sp.]|nr:DPP IV N-terminal domain-containing protein [Holophaga sp.]